MRIACFLLAALAGSLALADGGWVLTTADFRQQPVSFQSVDAAGAKIAPVGGGAPTVVPLEQFLQIDRADAAPETAEARFLLHGTAGDRIAGEPTGYKDERILWKSPMVGEMQVSLKSTSALVRGGKTVSPPADRSEDVILLANGDSIRGIVTDIGPVVKIASGGADVELPLENINAIYFAPAGQPKATTERMFRVGLRDGSLLTALSVESAAAELVLALPDKSQRRVPLAAVLGIEQLNGPVSWLSSRPAVATVQMPFFGSITWPTRLDATVTGRPIRFANRSYSRGIGVHAYSKIDYALDGAFRAFRTQYAVSTDVKAPFADVIVRIRLDGRTVHEQEHVRAGVLSPVVIIDIPSEAKLLTLEVDYGDANDTQDHFNWIEPALLRDRPATPPPTQPATAPATQ